MKNRHQKHVTDSYGLFSGKRLLPFAAALTFGFLSLLRAYPVQAAQEPSVPQENTVSQPEAADTVSAVTSIDSLSEEESYYIFDEKLSLEEVTALFPTALSVHIDGSSESVQLPVTWQCTEDYETTESDVYEFTPLWDNTAYPAAGTLKSWDIPGISVQIRQTLPDYFITDLPNADRQLAALAKEKDLLALVYLCSSYEIKTSPDLQTETVLTVPSGQSVKITGVAEDSMQNIWYQVRFQSGSTEYSGYAERKYLAYSDEKLLSWEKQFIAENTSRSAMPAQMSAEIQLPEDIKAFPSSYQNALAGLKELHPGWIFVRMDTGIDWNTAVQQENSKDRSLISSKSNAAWKDSPYDNAWSYPTDGILAYYMDPRNFLTENYIFQFELLSYNSTYHTETAVQDILKNTFMYGIIPDDGQGLTYSQAFYSIAQNLSVSPFHLASRVRQEQGDGKSPLISGSYPGYAGLYNYFNIGATGKGSAQIIENGLLKAKEYGWTTRYLSLAGGADIISKNYIRQGQDTLYLQKFNVSKTSPFGLYCHQYMQNIAAPSSEAVSVKKAYASAGSLDNPFVFRIPVYENMPSAPCTQPANLKSITLSTDSLTLKADETSVLTASIDGTAADISSVSFRSSDSRIATVSADGTVTAVSAGTAEISCASSGAATASCIVTVQKGTPLYTVPSLSPIIYNPALSLQGISLPTGWAWENPAIIPAVGNFGYPAVFTPEAPDKYLTVKEIIPLTVTKAVPAYTIPTGLQTFTGNTLASLKLPAGWTWENPAAVLTTAGTFSYPASYNPDTANYETVTGVSISVAVTEKTTACASHNYGDWLTAAPAACTVTGTQIRSCHQCCTQERAVIPALGHTYAASVTKQPTETEAGVRTYTCGRCGDTYTEEIAKLPAAHTHSYAAVITTAASCSQDGVLTYTCTCGDSYTETVPATGHSYIPQITKEASETECGIRTYTCGQCQHTYTETIPQLPATHRHSYTPSVTKQPTCTESGITSHICSCGDSYSEDIAALGHDLSDGKCRRCGYVQQSQNNALPDSGIPNASEGNASDGSGSNVPSGNGNAPGGNGSGASSGNGNAPGSNGSGASSGNGNAPGSNGSGASSGNGNAPGSNGSGASSGNSNALGGNGSNVPSDNGNAPSGNGSGVPSGNGNAPGGNAHIGTTGNNSSAGHANTSSNAPTIDMGTNSVLYEETLASLRGQDIDVTLDMGNNISWIINGKNILADEANGIDMGIRTDAGSIPAPLLAQAAGLGNVNRVIELELSHNGSFDFLPTLVLRTDTCYAGYYAALFYYNPEAGQLEYKDETTISETGEILFSFSHASGYIVIIGSESMSAIAAITESETGQAASGILPENLPEENLTVADIGIPQADSESGGSRPVVLLLLILLLLILAAIGLTVYFLLRRRKETAEDGTASEESISGIKFETMHADMKNADVFAKPDYSLTHAVPETTYKSKSPISQSKFPDNDSRDDWEYWKDGSLNELDYLDDDSNDELGYLDDDSNDEPDYLEDGSNGEPDYLEDDSNDEPNYLEDGSNGEPDYLEDGRNDEPNYLEDGSNNEPDYLDDNGKNKLDYLNENSKNNFSKTTRTTSSDYEILDDYSADDDYYEPEF